jgi:glucose/arabinose dehydrogenase
MSRPILRTLAALALPIAAACAPTGGAPADGTRTEVDTLRPATPAPDTAARAALPACDADNGGLMLPAGFCALVASEGVGPARHLTVAPNGDVYVSLQEPSGQESHSERGGIVALRDTTGDGRFDQIARFGKEGGTGISVQGEYLYFAPNDRVVRWRLAPGQLAPQGEPEVIVSGFPELRGHVSKSIAFDGKGALWVDVGSPSNACQEKDRQAGSPGRQPCPELERHAGVWRFDANRAGQKQSDGERWATGIRNAVALRYRAADNALYAVQHGRDQLDLWPGFTAADNAEKPAEELQRLDRGSDFGWPYCSYDGQQKKRVLAPEYGGNGSEVGQCARYATPVYAFPAHWAPNDLLFYTGSQFPTRYRNGAFVAWHGSWNRAPLPQGGYKVTFLPMEGSQPGGDFEDFADGFAGRPQIASPGDAEYRPMGLAEAPDGSLYIVDSRKGRIWRVLHRGG